MTYQEETKINDCTDCPDVPPHCQLNICVFQGSNENHGQVEAHQLEDSSSWRNDHVVIDEIEEFKSIDAQQEEEDKKSPAAMRSTSPTSTIIDASEEIKETQAQQQNTSSATTSSPSSTLRRSVSWREEIITDVIYRPRTNQSEKRGLYYNSSDMQRFRQHYKMQVRAAQDYQKRLRQDSVRNDKNSACESGSRSISKKRVVPTVTAKQQQQQHHLYTSPISGLINRMTGYLARTSSSSLNTSASASSSATVSIGPVADTCVLVDTLYLF